MKTLCSIAVRGKGHEWNFIFKADPKYLEEWRADGLEVYEVMNTVPEWAADIGLAHLWCRVQDAWRWLRMW